MAKEKKKLTKRQKESQKINRQRAIRMWWQTVSRRVLIGGVICSVIFGSAGGWWLFHSGKLAGVVNNTNDKIWQQTAKFGFKVENVYLEGRKFTPLYDVSKAMGVKTGAPILAISLEDMRLRLQAIPRVKYAEVARVLPDQLHIQIVEREPAAIWQNENKLHLIDNDGVVMEYVDPAQYKNLLLVVGEDAPNHVHDLFNIFALEPEMYKNVAAALRIGERRWNIRFKNGMELKLPEKDAEVAWQAFSRIEKEQKIMERMVRSVDMRLPDRIFIKATPADTKTDKNNGSET